MLRRNHITDVFPHLCPTRPSGEIMPVDDQQAELFCESSRFVSCVGWRVMDIDVSPDIPSRRRVFVDPRGASPEASAIGGVHLNVEPWRSGIAMLICWRKFAEPCPEQITLCRSVSAATRWHPFPNVHWEEVTLGKSPANKSDGGDDIRHALKDGNCINISCVPGHKRFLIGQRQGRRETPEILLGVPTYMMRVWATIIPRREYEERDPGIHAGLNRFQSPPLNIRGGCLL